jgi:rRNA processing protein Krr1/Pno1
MPNSVYGAQAIVKGSTIYILGGFSEARNSAVKNIQVYNPKENTWKISVEMKSARYDFFAGMYSDSIIYFGGAQASSVNSSSMEIWDYVSTPHIYDTNINFNRLYAAGLILKDKLYIFGGQTAALSYLAIYDIAKSKLIYSSDYSFNLHFPLQQMTIAKGNDIYLIGGTYGVLQNSIYKFSTLDNSLQKLSSELKHPRAGGVAITVADSSVYIIGGFDETEHALSSVEILKPGHEEIESEDGPPLNYPRADPVVVRYNNSIYVFGGIDKDGQPVSAVEKLDIITGISDHKSTPMNFELENNYPNPFNPSTNIGFKVGKTTKISLDIYSILGQHIRNITSQVYSPGSYNFTWNGLDDKGHSLPSSIYFYKITSDYFVDAKKMMLLK